MLKYGAFVALALLLIWAALLVCLVRGQLKTTSFGTASMFLALMVPFFWLGPEITELTISKIGSFKTNVQQATQYLDEIKKIHDKLKDQDIALSSSVNKLNEQIEATRERMKTQESALNSSVKTITVQIDEARKQSDKLQSLINQTVTAQKHIFDRKLNNLQIDNIVTTLLHFARTKIVLEACDTEECDSFAAQIVNVLEKSNWEVDYSTKKLPDAETDVQVYDDSSEGCPNSPAAKSFVESLKRNGIVAELHFSNTEVFVCFSIFRVLIGSAH